MTIGFQDVTSELLRAVPELRPAYEQARLEWQRDVPGDELEPDAVFSWVLVPFLQTLLGKRNAPRGGDVCVRIFAFLEKLARQNEQAIHSLVGVSVCEALVDEQRTYMAALPFMGARTKEIMLLALGSEETESSECCPSRKVHPGPESS